MAKSRLIKTTVADNGNLIFTVGEAGSIELVVSELSDAISHQAMLHGLGQKVSDAAAMPKAELSGNPKKDAVTKLAAMKAVAERLANGEWSARSGDGSSPVQGLIFRAYEEYVTARFEAAKKDVPSDETIRAQYEKMERKEKLALRNVPEIAAIIERIKSERPAKDVAAVDTDALLGDLGL